MVLRKHYKVLLAMEALVSIGRYSEAGKMYDDTMDFLFVSRVKAI